MGPTQLSLNNPSVETRKSGKTLCYHLMVQGTYRMKYNEKSMTILCIKINSSLKKTIHSISMCKRSNMPLFTSTSWPIFTNLFKEFHS